MASNGSEHEVGATDNSDNSYGVISEITNGNVSIDESFDSSEITDYNDPNDKNDHE